MVAFGMILVGGLNFLFMGMFNFNLFALIFGHSVVARVIYSMLGLASVFLWSVILWKAFMHNTPTERKIEKVVESVASAVSSPATK
jgi:uncharacterized membrane protein YuzA (DUF378 family)